MENFISFMAARIRLTRTQKRIRFCEIEQRRRKRNFQTTEHITYVLEFVLFFFMNEGKNVNKVSVCYLSFGAFMACGEEVKNDGF